MRRRAHLVWWHVRILLLLPAGHMQEKKEVIKTSVGVTLRAFAVGVRCVALISCLVLVCFGTGCTRKKDWVVVRILLPPSSSAVRDAIVKLEAFPLQTDTGKPIYPATMETSDEHRYREFLQSVQTYRPQVLIVPSVEDIPAPFQGETRYATLPCSILPRRCVAVVAPWATTEERRAADIVLRRIGPDANTK
jgi:hypothetical protein